MTVLNVVGRRLRLGARLAKQGAEDGSSDSLGIKVLLRRASSYAPLLATFGALLAACIALFGYGMVGFWAYTRYYAPASSHYVRPLHFDYTGFVAVAYAPLVTQLPPRGGARTPPPPQLLPKSRFLPSGTQVAVYVRLFIPYDHTDLFQVTGELISNETHVAARSVRTHINTPQPAAYRFAKYMLLLPLHVLGLGHGDWVRVDLPLFDAYEEREGVPVASFRARLASRNASRGGAPPPPVYRAELHVRLRLGPIQTVLHWLRPGPFLGWIVLLVGLGASIGGSCGVVGLLVLAFLLRRWAVSWQKVSAGGRGRRRSAAGLVVPRRHSKHDDVPPFGDADEAMLYSLSHAQVFRSDGGRAAMVEDYCTEDDLSYGQHEYGGGLSRQGSAYSQAAAAPPPTQAVIGGFPAWSGGSGDSSAYASSPDGKPAAGAGGDYDHGRGSRLPSPQPSGEVSAPIAPAPPLDAAAAAAANGSWSPPAAQPPQEGGDAAADSLDGGRQGDEDGEKDEEESSEGDDGDQEEEDEVAGGEVDEPVATPGKGPAAAAKAMRGDLEPEADNEAAGGVVRKRSGFAWQA